MLKKFFYIPVILLILSGCSLPNRAPAELTTEARLDLSFQLPGDSIKTSPSTRMLLAETSTVEIILYRPFDGDTLTADQAPSVTDIANLSGSEQVISETLSFSSGSQITHSISNIPLGDWNLIVGSFLSDTPQWKDPDLSIPGPVSFSVYQNLMLEAGTNQLALTMAANQEMGNILDISTNLDGLTVIGDTSLAETMVFNLQNMDLNQNYTINLTQDAVLEGLVELNFYDTAGNLLPVVFSSGTALLDMSAMDNNLVMTLRGNAGLNLLANERLQIDITHSHSGPTLNLAISVYEIPPQLTLNLDGLILPDADRIEAYLYQTFTGDPMDPALTPSQVVLTSIESGTASIFPATASYTGAAVQLLFDQADITTGSWNLVVAALDSSAVDWTSPQSFAWAEAIDLQSGSNTSSLNMRPNINNTDYYSINDLDGLMFTWSDSTSYAANVTPQLTAGTPVTFTVDNGDALSNFWSDVTFYTQTGELVDIPPAITGTQYSWTYTPLNTGDQLVMLITPNSGNYAVMDISFIPVAGGFNIEITGRSSLVLQLDGLILPDAARIEGHIYKTYAGDPIDPVTAPTYEMLYDISFNDPSSVFSATATYTGGPVQLSFNAPAITSGTWNLVVAVLDADASSWSTPDLTSSAQSFVWGDSLELLNGSNTETLTLRPNSGYGSYSIIDPLDGAFLQWDGTKSYFVAYRDGLTAGTPVTFTIDEGAALSEIWSDIQFYNGIGELQTISPVVSGTQYSWTYTPLSDNDQLHLLVTPNSSNYSSMDIDLLPVAGGFSVNIVGYTDMLLQLDGVLLPDTAVVDVILYQIDTFSLPLSSASPGVIITDISNLISNSTSVHRTISAANIDVNNQLLVEGIPQGDYRILISAVGSDYYTDPNITWELYGTDSQYYFSPSSYYENVNLTTLTGGFNSIPITLMPNYTRYPEYTAGSTMQWMASTPSWDSNGTKDYILIFLNSFVEETSYTFNFQTFYTLDFLFENVSFFNAKGIQEDMNYNVYLTNSGEILHEWTYNDTLDNDLLMMLFEVDKTKALRYLDVGMNPYLYLYYDPMIQSLSETSMYTNQISTSFIDLEKSLMTKSDYTLDVLMYDGAPLPPNPTQAEIDLLLNERGVTRGSINMIEATGIVAYHNNRVFAGTWNFLFGSFIGTPASWNAEYDGGATIVPAYLGYGNLDNQAISGTSLTTSLAENLQLNEEKYSYLAGGSWGSGPNGYYDFQNGTSFTYTDTEGGPLVLVFTNLKASDNRIYMNMDGLLSSFRVSFYKLDGTYLFSSTLGDLPVTSDAGIPGYTHYLTVPFEATDTAYIMTVSSNVIYEATLNIEPNAFGFGVQATQPPF